MVCKEEVLTWFKDLDSYKRIDVLCEILNMLVPFELRFLGSCVEEIGKHTYQELRGQALIANDLEKLSKDVMFQKQSLYEEAVRHRVLLNLSLLTSRNFSVANWYCNKFLRTDYIEDLIVKEKDDLVQNELLLLFTMASRHPAFSFDQREFFSKILVQLCDIRESRLISKANSYGYPPGFGYPTVQRKNVVEHQGPNSFPIQPPGLPHPQVDFISPLRTWPGIPCGAPEVPPFPQPLQPPQPTASPLVSQAGSPNQSRSTSPHRPPIIRPPPPMLPPPPPPQPQPTVLPQATVFPTELPLQLPPPVEIMPPPTIPLPPPPILMPMEQPFSQSSQQPSPVYSQSVEARAENELPMGLKEEPKPLPLPLWPPHPSTSEIKSMNGMRFPFATGKIRQSLSDQMQSMAMTDNENTLYQSNSSSNSSPNPTPPGTPATICSTVTTTAATTLPTLHGPGRGPAERVRANGLPPHTFPPPLCDTTSPPPPAAFSNCATVPYSYQSFTLPPTNRSVFQYNTPYRPTFTAPYHFQGDNSFPTYSFPYFSLMYSSYPLTPRTPPGCYNCGAPSHVGSDCTQQNIEEITQKKTYQLDYSQVQSQDGDK